MSTKITVSNMSSSMTVSGDSTEVRVLRVRPTLGDENAEYNYLGAQDTYPTESYQNTDLKAGDYFLHTGISPNQLAYYDGSVWLLPYEDASNSSNSADSAKTSENNSADSEAASKSSESEAADSATAAENSANQSEESFNSFDNIYLGAKSSPPTQNNQGGSLEESMLYWLVSTSSSPGKLYAYNGSEWLEIDQIVDGTLTTKGIVQLRNSVTSNANNFAATSNSVKNAYDKGLQALNAANNAQNKSDNSELLDGLNSSQFLRSDQDAILDGKLTTTGDIYTGFSSNIVSGYGQGSVALTSNDGYGNANVTFNHVRGAADKDGNSGRISVNTDSGGSNPAMSFRIGSLLTSDGGQSLTTIMNIKPTGVEVTGNVTATNFLGVASSAQQLENSRTISLTGDASGSVSFDGTSNVSIEVAIANNSHNHDNQYFTQDQSDSKYANLTGDTFIGTVIMDAASGTSLILRRDGDYVDAPAQLLITGDGDIPADDLAIEIRGRVDGSGVDTSITLDSPDTKFAVFSSGVTAIGYSNLGSEYENPESSLFAVNGSGYFEQVLYAEGSNRVFHTNHHPNADKLTTARTISLTGDASGSVSFDGSSNVIIPVVVNNNSHNHNDQYFTENESDSRFLGINAKSVDSELLDGINGNDYTRKDLTNLGKTGNLAPDGNTNTSQEWSNLPVGYSSMMKNTIGITGGAPVDNYGYFVKIANQTNDGGWAGLWAGYNLGQNFIGRTSTSSDFASWERLYSDDYHPEANKLTNSRTISLTGDASGSVSFDGSSNVNIEVAVAVESYDARYLGINAKADDSELLDGINSGQFLRSDQDDTFNGKLSVNGSIVSSGTGADSGISVGVGSGAVGMTVNDGQGNSNVTFNHKDGKADQDGNGGRISVNTDNSNVASMEFKLKSGLTADGNPVVLDTVMTLKESGLEVFGDVTATNFIGNASSATRLQNARTISLTGDASGSVSFDGSSNVSIPIVIANNSHNHNDQYFTETESDNRFLGINAKADDSELLDGINSSQFLRSDQNAVLTGNLSLTGSVTAGETGNVSVGIGSGSVALTINDGGGNSSLTFNHIANTPDQDGNSARITFNSDSTSSATMSFQLKSNVTNGVSASLDNKMALSEDGLYVNDGVKSGVQPVVGDDLTRKDYVDSNFGTDGTSTRNNNENDIRFARVIAEGTNANGKYVVWDDNRVEMWHSITVSTSGTTWTYPLSGVANARIQLTANRANYSATAAHVHSLDSDSAILYCNVTRPVYVYLKGTV
jgi:hypothetical protein